MASKRNIRVEKVSRRNILKGLGITGGFVLAAPCDVSPGLCL